MERKESSLLQFKIPLNVIATHPKYCLPCDLVTKMKSLLPKIVVQSPFWEFNSCSASQRKEISSSKKPATFFFLQKNPPHNLPSYDFS
jgi:hypothetical protein